jgi:hypothetical protein
VKLGKLLLPANSRYPADTIDMALNKMAAEASIRPHCPFEIDFSSALKSAEGAAAERFLAHVKNSRRTFQHRYRQANTVYRDAVPCFCSFGSRTQLNLHLQTASMRADPTNKTYLFYNTRKHIIFLLFVFLLIFESI